MANGKRTAGETTIKGFDAIEAALIAGSLADAFRVAVALQDAAADVENTEATIAASDATIAPPRRGAR